MSIDLWLYDISTSHSDFPDNLSTLKMRDFSIAMRTKILATLLNKNINDITFSKTNSGKPYVKNNGGLRFNVSHTGTLWGMAVSYNDTEVGLDIEKARERKYMKEMMEEYFHPSEVSYYKRLQTKPTQTELFYKLWTQKEAYAKYLGQGLGYSFSDNSFLNGFPENENIISGLLLPRKPEKHNIHLSLVSSSLVLSEDLVLFGDKSLKVRITD